MPSGSGATQKCGGRSVRYLLIPFWAAAFVFTLIGMLVTLDLLCHFNPCSSTSLGDRVQFALQLSLTGELSLAATVLCTLNALSQYGFRHTARRIAEEGEPNTRGGFRWMRALQSVVIAWAIWYGTLICHCLLDGR